MEKILYQGSEKKDELIILDKEITHQTDELLKIKKQNKKLETKYLPKPDSNLRKLTALMAEIDLMQSKRLNAEKFLLSKYAFDLQDDTLCLDVSSLPSPKNVLPAKMLPSRRFKQDNTPSGTGGPDF